jgi:hypothetical protein
MGAGREEAVDRSSRNEPGWDAERSSLEGYIAVKDLAVAQRIADLKAAGPLGQLYRQKLDLKVEVGKLS